VILRAMVNLEAQGGEKFFGEPELDPSDLMRVVDGKGVISLLELSEQQTNPMLFSTFLMWLLAELFEHLPEAGDLDKPKVVFFFDEAHLLFSDASKAFLDRIEQTVKLIRSKGVGVFFCTQLPTDIRTTCSPSSAPGSSTPCARSPGRPEGAGPDREDVPDNAELQAGEVLTSLGIGEAIVTVLSERGAPTPVAWCRLRAPRSLMGAIGADGVASAAHSSPLYAKYGQTVDRESAYEKLTARWPGPAPEQAPEARPAERPRAEREEPGALEQIMSNPAVKSFHALGGQLAGPGDHPGLFGTRRR